MQEDRQSGPRRSSTPNPEFPGLFEGLDVGVLVHDTRSEILYANQMALELLGLRRDQVLGTTSFDPSWDIVRPDGTPFPPEQRPVARVLATGEPVLDVVIGVRRPGQSRAWLLANSRPHHAGASEPTYVVTTLSDISSERRRMSLLEQVKDELEEAVRRRTSQLAATVEELQSEIQQREAAETALARSQTAFQQVTEAVPGVLYQAMRFDDGRIALRFISAHVREMFGLSPDQARADVTALVECLDLEGRWRAARTLLQAARDRSLWQCEVRLRPRGGAGRWVRNRAVPQRLEGGTLWSGLVVDITEERTLADQVRVAQTREAIGSVTAGIAHNFNNALAVIVPNLEESLEAVPTPVRQPLEESLQTARSAAALVEQLMLVARGSTPNRHEPVDLVALIQDITGLCRRIFQGRIVVEEQLPAGRIRVMGQTAPLRQVLLNLCINARDALQDIEHGRVAVRVDLLGRDGDAPRVRICVEDNGCGMNELTLRRLGEPFFTTKAPGHGTGLGLATAYATIRDLGGAIACDSVPAEGSTFTITLPLHDVDEPRPEPTPTRARPRPRPRGRILLIDDEQLVRRAMRQVLGRRGFEVDEADDGAAGLDTLAAAAEPYQAVLLDLSMPGVSGERVLERLRRSHPSLPVVVLSGFVEDPERVASASAVLHKPVSARELMATLDRLLG